jgi:hypothetical protein
MLRVATILCEELLSKNTSATSVDSVGMWIVYLFRPHEQEPVSGCSRTILSFYHHSNTVV